MKGKDGRTKAKIKWREVDTWLQAQANGTEIASHLGIHPNTLYRRCEEEHGMSFSEYSQQKKSSGKMMLKIMQFEKAQEGNVPMQIWLGKNYLEQKDKVE
jgi:transposase-like protein